MSKQMLHIFKINEDYLWHHIYSILKQFYAQSLDILWSMYSWTFKFSSFRHIIRACCTYYISQKQSTKVHYLLKGGVLYKLFLVLRRKSVSPCRNFKWRQRTKTWLRTCWKIYVEKNLISTGKILLLLILHMVSINDFRTDMFCMTVNDLKA